MPDTTAKIRAKGLDATGITESIAEQMYAHKGRHYMAIVELKVDETTEKADGQRGVHLVLTQVEPAIDPGLEEHLRELTRVTYYNRAVDAEQPSLDGVGSERTVADVMAAGAGHKPHPFLPDDAANEHPICDVCGQLEAAAAHSVQDALPADQDDDEDGPEHDDEGEDDEEEPVDDQDNVIPHTRAYSDPFTPTPA